jgi:hypothetical protein
MNKLFTIVYYTSNRENEKFEQTIRQKLMAVCGDIPIISVSYKPIDLGKNICVGEHIPSNAMIFRQLLMGCEAATTPFVINAEADFLYCPEYFTFTPPKENQIYRYDNIRMLYKYNWGFFRKPYSEGAQITGREYLISLLQERLKDAPEDTKFNPYHRIPLEMFGGENACVSFKTGDSLHKYMALGRERSVPELPYWGTVEDMRKEMFSHI